MRTLLRHALTGQYYQSSGQWTTNPERAHDFIFIDRAISFARKTSSPNMEIGLYFNNARRASSFRFKELLTDC